MTRAVYLCQFLHQRELLARRQAGHLGVVHWPQQTADWLTLSVYGRAGCPETAWRPWQAADVWPTPATGRPDLDQLEATAAQLVQQECLVTLGGVAWALTPAGYQLAQPTPALTVVGEELAWWESRLPQDDRRLTDYARAASYSLSNHRRARDEVAGLLAGDGSDRQRWATILDCLARLRAELAAELEC